MPSARKTSADFIEAPSRASVTLATISVSCAIVFTAAWIDSFFRISEITHSSLPFSSTSTDAPMIRQYVLGIGVGTIRLSFSDRTVSPPRLSLSPALPGWRWARGSAAGLANQLQLTVTDFREMYLRGYVPDICPAKASRHAILGLTYSAVDEKSDAGQTREMTIPLWMLSVPSGMISVVCCANLFTLCRRRRTGCCRRCRYDLRATPHRCPECGTANPNTISLNSEHSGIAS